MLINFEVWGASKSIFLKLIFFYSLHNLICFQLLNFLQFGNILPQNHSCPPNPTEDNSWNTYLTILDLKNQTIYAYLIIVLGKIPSFRQI